MVWRGGDWWRRRSSSAKHVDHKAAAAKSSPSPTTVKVAGLEGVPRELTDYPPEFTDPAMLRRLYEHMQLIRRMEMKADALYKQRHIRGFCHLAIGQEAIPVGIELALGPQDQIITAYRCHGFALLRNRMNVRGVLAELLGRTTGLSRGKGGSMHMYGERFYGGNGIVGAQVSLGTGLAFAQQYLRDEALQLGANTMDGNGNARTEEDGGLTLCLYGDGAANQGQVYESFNHAALWKLPVVFICENNQYSMGTSVQRSTPHGDFYARGLPAIPGLRVNGMDVLQVAQAVRFAQRHVLREQRGPLIIELDTYRYQGHSMSDPGTTYRTRDEIAQVRQTRDPLHLLLQRLDPAVRAQAIPEIDERAKAAVEEAAQLALADPLPIVDRDLMTDVY